MNKILLGGLIYIIMSCVSTQKSAVVCENYYLKFSSGVEDIDPIKGTDFIYEMCSWHCGFMNIKVDSIHPHLYDYKCNQYDVFSKKEKFNYTLTASDRFGDDPRFIDGFYLSNGARGSDSVYHHYGRVKTLLVTINKKYKAKLAFQDTPKVQHVYLDSSFTFDSEKSLSIEFKIIDQYGGQSVDSVAIAELECDGREGHSQSYRLCYEKKYSK